MKTLTLLAAITLTGCATWAPTREALIRRRAEQQLRFCVGPAPIIRNVHRNPFVVRECRMQVRRWCLDQGLEQDCGELPLVMGDL